MKINLILFCNLLDLHYLCSEKQEKKAMCTITLEYNKNNALARRKLAALLATGLFLQKEEKVDEPTPEELEAHRKERDEFLYASKILAAKAFARHL